MKNALQSTILKYPPVMTTYIILHLIEDKSDDTVLDSKIKFEEVYTHVQKLMLNKAPGDDCMNTYKMLDSDWSCPPWSFLTRSWPFDISCHRGVRWVSFLFIKVEKNRCTNVTNTDQLRFFRHSTNCSKVFYSPENSNRVWLVCWLISKKSAVNKVSKMTWIIYLRRLLVPEWQC